jgi:hypothetical protein
LYEPKITIYAVNHQRWLGFKNLLICRKQKCFGQDGVFLNHELPHKAERMKKSNLKWNGTSQGFEAYGKNRGLSRIILPVILAAITFLAGSFKIVEEERAKEPLRFVTGEAGSFTFNTGVLKGVLRHKGRSIGLVPVTYIEDGTEIATGEGLFNHYRVFCHGKRYGYGARRWPSTAELHKDGSVEVYWPETPDRPFELKAVYSWTAPNTLDLVTIVRAGKKLEAFEVFLASYFGPAFTDSRVWASRDPRGPLKEGFVSADRELGEWLAFPRDEQAAEVITDGRWELGSSPLEWTMMPDFALPLAIRRDTSSGLAVIVMSRHDDCFGIFTPYGEEKHISNYLSLFGNDIKAGETEIARTRLVVLPDPSESEILEITEAFLKSSP